MLNSRSSTVKLLRIKNLSLRWFRSFGGAFFEVDWLSAGGVGDDSGPSSWGLAVRSVDGFRVVGEVAEGPVGAV